MLDTTGLLYRVKQIRKLEDIAVQKYQISKYTLMQRAGSKVFRELKRCWPQVKRITIVCGKGNNAGDGYVVASIAKKHNLDVLVLQLFPHESLNGAAQKAANECKKLKVRMEPFSAEKLGNAEVIVDALLGIGLVGDVRSQFKDAINAINSTKIPVIAVDIPSGIDADTGKVHGVAIKAELSVTFIGHKLGLYLGQAHDYSGSIICDNLGLKENVFSKIRPCAQILNLTEELKLLSPRLCASHKGNFGNVLVIGGDYGMGGAVHLAAEAAARVGAGSVSVATRSEHIVSINTARPEIMVYGINTVKQLCPILKKASVVVIGPGLGVSEWGKRLFNAALAAGKLLVIDADALNILSANPRAYNNWVLTPHPGEAGRLLNISTNDIQANRLSSVCQLQQNFGGVCVLKGSGSLIAAAEETIRVCDAGNPGMASGGMGDILSGIIGGLLSQGLSLFNASNLGVIVHATAGDLVAGKYGEKGMLALDLLPIVRKILNLKHYED